MTDQTIDTETATDLDGGDHSANAVAVASQWQLMIWKFRRHKLAMVGFFIIVFLYSIALFAELVAPFSPHDYNRRGGFHPPQMIHFIDQTDDGWNLKPYVIKTKRKRNSITLATTYTPTDDKIYLEFFGAGSTYKMWGLFDANTRFLTTINPKEKFYLLGADRLGRDMFSRIIYGARLSLSIGLVGVVFALVLGLSLGGISGYFGGFTDTVIQRLVEFVLSLPAIPVWLALAAALPPTWAIEIRYFVITLIVSVVGWTELARVVRGRFLALRHEDFVIAARLDGVSETRIIFRHMLPSLSSHIIASVTLAVPLMILAETSLSFLGLGLMSPAISWGVLLKEAQDVRSIVQGPWLFAPGGAVVLTVLAFNFFGDGLRDAADPYSN